MHFNEIQQKLEQKNTYDKIYFNFKRIKNQGMAIYIYLYIQYVYTIDYLYIQYMYIQLIFY